MGQGTVEYSEATAELIDNEVREIINTQYARALDILRGKKQFLEKAAHVLLEKEKIDGEELKTLMAENS
jgi:cell division protease FtsH